MVFEDIKLGLEDDRIEKSGLVTLVQNEGNAEEKSDTIQRFVRFLNLSITFFIFRKMLY
jgi:hypothetical protein